MSSDIENNISISEEYGSLLATTTCTCVVLGMTFLYFTVFGIIGIASGVCFKLTIMLALWFMTLGWGEIMLYSAIGGFCLGVLMCPYITCLYFSNRY